MRWGNRRQKENWINILANFKSTYTKIYGINNYFKELDKTREDLAISISLEPTAEEINIMESSCEKKSTELEMIIMELKLLTTIYAKDIIFNRDKNLKDENTKLNTANN